MDHTQAILEVETYARKRHEIRKTLISYLREHRDELIPDGNTLRKLMHYPSDLSDIRLAGLVEVIANE